MSQQVQDQEVQQIICYKDNKTILNYQLNFQVDYRKIFDKHDLNASIIYEQREEDMTWFSGRVEDFATFSIDQIVCS
jgi:hypothetical protein